MTTTEQARKAAFDAEQLLRNIGRTAANIAKTTRSEMRVVHADLSIHDINKGRIKTNLRHASDLQLRDLDTTTKAALRAVEEYVTVARALPPAGDAATEMRRSRAYDAIKDAIGLHPSDGAQSAAILNLYQQFDAARDMTSLQALRELVKHRELAGREVPSLVPERLDAIAGPTETRAAMVLAESAKTAAYSARITIGMARDAVADDPMTDSPLIGLEPDGTTTYLIDEWKPESSASVMSGAVSVTE